MYRNTRAVKIYRNIGLVIRYTQNQQAELSTRNKESLFFLCPFVGSAEREIALGVHWIIHGC